MNPDRDLSEAERVRLYDVVSRGLGKRRGESISEAAARLVRDGTFCTARLAATCMALHAVERRQVVAYVGELCLEHARMAAGVLSAFAAANGMEASFIEVLERAHPETARKGPGPS